MVKGKFIDLDQLDMPPSNQSGQSYLIAEVCASISNYWRMELNLLYIYVFIKVISDLSCVQDIIATYIRQ